MVSSDEVVKLVESFSLTERLLIVEEILKSIRKEKLEVERVEDARPGILALAGIISDNEAESWHEAIDEARKIDVHEW